MYASILTTSAFAKRTTLQVAHLLVPAVFLVLASGSTSNGQGLQSASKISGTKISTWQMPSEVKHFPDLTYCETENGPLKLDVVAPKTGDGPFPVVVIIHAIGPWAKGRQYYLPQAAEFAREGYIGVAISYRHTPDAAFPKAIEDVEAAIRWLRAHSTKFNIDSSRIAALGYSGGGALACLLGMKCDGKLIGQGANPSSRVQAVVAYYPPSDFTQLHQDCTNGNVPFPQGLLISAGFEAWFGGTPANVPAKYLQASPVSHIHKEMAPMLLIHGEEDSIVPITQSQNFMKKAAAKRARVTFLALPQAGHDLDEGLTVNAQIAKSSARTFLYGHLFTLGSDTAKRFAAR